jgi:4-carboxymuconolactone decarboxylase
MYEDLLENGRKVMAKLGIQSPEQSSHDQRDSNRSTGVLFGDVWSDDRYLALEERSLITVVCLMVTGGVEEPLRIHLRGARRLGMTREKIDAVITHLAFYMGYPKTFTARRIAREVFAEVPDTGRGT